MCFIYKWRNWIFSLCNKLFSYTGNTKMIANKIREKLNCDIKEQDIENWIKTL